MADAHGSGPHPSEPEEDVLRTPGWMPLLGLGLLLAGALGVYLWISPGIANPSATADAGADGGTDGGTDAGPGGSAAPGTAPGH
jgi:hypothetical protein